MSKYIVREFDGEFIILVKTIERKKSGFLKWKDIEVYKRADFRGNPYFFNVYATIPLSKTYLSLYDAKMKIKSWNKGVTDHIID